ncbi:hypothetical protein SAMN05421780_1191, partial [Flexibacter flexilis DSM 6793]
YIPYSESVGIGKLFAAYAENATAEAIKIVGFNELTGCVYMELENGICINSCLGESVHYTTPYHEQEFMSYKQAVKYKEYAEYLRSIQDGTPEAVQDIKFEDEGDNPYAISSLF